MTNETEEKQAQVFPQITPGRVKEELKRARMEIAHDMEEIETKYRPCKADGTTLGNIVINS